MVTDITRGWRATAASCLASFGIACAIAVGASGDVTPIPAFPGAEGFGATALGGRGGVVIEVTNLNDSGPGSLRAAIEAEGPRTVVFRVAGTIQLHSSMVVENPYITIAGQTAPGGGITLRNATYNGKVPIKVHTHDVVIRYIRSRPGSSFWENGTLDAITIGHELEDVHHVIVDHGSFSWATDEVLNVYYAAHEITVQWSIISEGLDCSTHVENGKRQCHSMGMLLGSVGGRNYSIHHNLFAHNRHRNPRIKMTGTVDVVNNIIYNSGSGEGWRSPTYVNGEHAVVPVNYIANYFRAGPDSGDAAWFIDTRWIVQIYAAQNVVPNLVIDPDSESMLVPAPHAAAPVTTQSIPDAFMSLIADVGASRGLSCNGQSYLRRDSVDWRVVSDMLYGTGGIIDEPTQVGGWPKLRQAEPCADSDHDGMPDVYETIQGFDPNNPDDGREDQDGDGWTNLEEFLAP